MKRFRVFTVKKLVLVAVLSISLAANPALARSPVKLQQWMGTIDLSIDGPVPYELAGVASHLGRFTAYGEADFVPGTEEGTLVGIGPVVFEAANGDLLVGMADWQVAPVVADASTTAIHFSWRDAVEFSDGTIVASTGRFEHDRPPGLVVIAIIAVLIGLLLPAVQKVRDASAR